MSIQALNSYKLPPFWLPLSQGRFFGSSLGVASLTTMTVSSGQLYGCPIFVPLSVTLTAIGIEVTTNATGNVQLGMYNDNGGTPGSLLFDAGNVSTGSPNAFKSISISQAVSPGWYWLAGIFSATPAVRAITTANSLHLLGFSSGTDTTVHTGLNVAQAYGALPNPFTAAPSLSTTNFPRFMVQV